MKYGNYLLVATYNNGANISYTFYESYMDAHNHMVLNMDATVKECEEVEYWSDSTNAYVQTIDGNNYYWEIICLGAEGETDEICTGQ